MIDYTTSAHLDKVLDDVIAERRSAHVKHGPQTHPDGTGWASDALLADVAREACDKATADGRLTWRHILLEEVREALAETDPAKLRAELVQVASVAVDWLVDLDKRQVAMHWLQAASR